MFNRAIHNYCYGIKISPEKIKKKIIKILSQISLCNEFFIENDLLSINFTFLFFWFVKKGEKNVETEYNYVWEWERRRKKGSKIIEAFYYIHKLNLKCASRTNARKTFYCLSYFDMLPGIWLLKIYLEHFITQCLWVRNFKSQFI